MKHNRKGEHAASTLRRYTDSSSTYLWESSLDDIWENEYRKARSRKTKPKSQSSSPQKPSHHEQEEIV